jgi:putative membrane protein
MILQILLAILLGFLFGTITGLIPGIHINLIALMAISITPTLFLNFNPFPIAIFIVAMAVTHSFLDFIPSIYLGAPDEDTALSVLPGHKYLLQGEAHKAVVLTLIGSTSAIFLLLIVIPLFFLIIPPIIGPVERMMSWILVWISIFLITDTKNKIDGTIVFILAGFLGISTLNLNMSEPLLPLLTGLFGTSTILYSIQTKINPPKQQIKKIKISKKELVKPLLTTTLVSPFCSFLPGLGSSQAAIIGSKITGKLSKDQFLILLGSINTLVITTSFFTLYLINKTRTGAASAISNLISLEVSNLYFVALAIIISAALAIPLAIKISRIIAKNLHKINYSKISKIILVLLILITLLISGFIGLLVLLTSTSLGLLCNFLGVRKSLLMGCLLIPTILFYWPF